MSVVAYCHRRCRWSPVTRTDESRIIRVSFVCVYSLRFWAIGQLICELFTTASSGWERYSLSLPPISYIWPLGRWTKSSRWFIFCQHGMVQNFPALHYQSDLRQFARKFCMFYFCSWKYYNSSIGTFHHVETRRTMQTAKQQIRRLHPVYPTESSFLFLASFHFLLFISTASPFWSTAPHLRLSIQVRCAIPYPFSIVFLLLQGISAQNNHKPADMPYEKTRLSDNKDEDMCRFCILSVWCLWTQKKISRYNCPIDGLA